MTENLKIHQYVYYNMIYRMRNVSLSVTGGLAEIAASP